MIENKGNNKKTLLIALLVVGVISITLGVSIAFFNYTRTGLVNNIGTGRIYFNSIQDGRLQLSNIFPVKSSDVDPNTLDSVTVGIVGDTTYEDGEEFQITLVDVQNTVNGKQIPINFIATYTANTDAVIGTESNDYWNARESKDASIYTLEETGSVEEDKQILVGYIDNGTTGINGTLTIKAYIDADRIAITDTPEENVDWQNGRTVFSTTEWNSFQTSSTPISFKIKAESNEGIWVEAPNRLPTMEEMCPGCKFVYATLDDDRIQFYTTEKNTPTVLTSGYSENYNDIVTSSGKNYFLGFITNESNQITNAYVCGIKDSIPFCLDGSNLRASRDLLNGPSLWNNTCDSEIEVEEYEGVEYESGGFSCGYNDDSSSLFVNASDMEVGVYADVDHLHGCNFIDGEAVCRNIND